MVSLRIFVFFIPCCGYWGPSGNGRIEPLHYIAELHPCYSYEHRFSNQLPLLLPSDCILLQLMWCMTRVTAGDYCHLISKHSTNGWLTSPDAHKYLEITWVFEGTCRYTKMAANIFKCLSVSLNSMQSYSITRKLLGSEALPSPSDGLQKPNYNSLSHQGSICKSSGRPKVWPDLIDRLRTLDI